jgi:hypothetical protein
MKPLRSTIMRSVPFARGLLGVVAFAATAAIAAAQDAARPASEHELGAGGWAFMLLSLAFVWGLTFWCFKRVLATPEHVDPGPAATP